MILYIDTIGPKPQRSRKTETTINPVHYCLSHSRFGDYGLVKHPNGGLTFHTYEPRLVTRTAAGR